jgi:hypothetical protein
VPVAAEVDPFQAEIGRDQRVVRTLATTWTRKKSQHSAVVSNSSENGRAGPRLCQPSNPGNQRFLGNHHGNYYKLGSPATLAFALGMQRDEFKDLVFRLSLSWD